MATAIQIARAVAATVGLGQVNTLIGGDILASASLALMNRGGRNLASKRGPFDEGWLELTKQHLITIEDNVLTYPLPADFVNVINGTVWDRTGSWKAYGPLTPQEDQLVRSDYPGWWTVNPLYRIVSGATNKELRLSRDSAPDTGSTLALEYVSSHWVRPAEGAAPSKDVIDADGDVPVFPVNLVEMDLEWRMRSRASLPYDVALGEFERELDRVFAQNVQPPTIRLAEQDDILGSPLQNIGGVSTDGDGGTVDPVVGGTRYFGWSNDRTIDNSDFSGATESETNSGRLPSRASNGYPWFGLPVVLGDPTTLVIGDSANQISFYEKLPSTVNGVNVWVSHAEQISGLAGHLVTVGGFS